MAALGALTAIWSADHRPEGVAVIAAMANQVGTLIVRATLPGF